MPGAAASPMQQFDLALNLSTKKTRKRALLEQMQQVVAKVGGFDCARCTGKAYRAATVSRRGAAAHSLHAAVV